MLNPLRSKVDALQKRLKITAFTLNASLNLVMI